VADDSAEALNLARVLLARTGMKIDTVLTGSEALKMISYNHYNLIVLDNVLSDMSAVEVMRAIKEGRGINVNTPVIVCTTGDRDEVMDMYLGEGFADVARKPLSGEQIERLTERFLPARLVSRREIL
jgi:twitching motility two-component system response regulator PilH/two-component system chemotaxis response regulator CheY